MSNPAEGQTVLAGMIAGAVVACLDKLIEQRWPNSRINSVFDVVARVIPVLVREVMGKPSPRPTVRQSEADRIKLFEAEAEASTPFVDPMAIAEVFDVVADYRKRDSFYGSAAAASDPSSDAYWDRADIQEWAAAHPKLAADLKRLNGRS